MFFSLKKTVLVLIGIALCLGALYLAHASDAATDKWAIFLNGITFTIGTSSLIRVLFNIE